MHTLEDIRREYDRLDRLCGVDTRSIRLSNPQKSFSAWGGFGFPPPPAAGRCKIRFSRWVCRTATCYWTPFLKNNPPRWFYSGPEKNTDNTALGQMPSRRGD